MMRIERMNQTCFRRIVIAALALTCALFSLDGILYSSSLSYTIGVDAASSNSAFECHSDYDCNLDDDTSTSNGPVVKRYCRFVFDSDIKSASFCSYDPAEDTLYGSPFACQDDDGCRYGYCSFLYSNGTDTDTDATMTTNTIARNENATNTLLEEEWNDEDEAMTSKPVSSHCVCDAGFMGLSCQNRCTATCQNGGQCVAHYDAAESTPVSSHSPGSTYISNDEKDKLQGETTLDQTTSNIAKFHIRCDCPAGYSGFLCEVDDLNEKSMSMEAKSMFSVSGVIVFIVAVVALVFVQRRRRRNNALRQELGHKDRDNYNIQSRYTDDADPTMLEGKRTSLWDIPTIKTSTSSLNSSDSMPSPIGSVRVAISSMVTSVKDRISPTASQTGRATSLSMSQVASSLADARAKRTENQNIRRMEREHVMASRAARRLAELQNNDEEISYSSDLSNAFSSTSSSKQTSTSRTKSSMSGAAFAKSKSSNPGSGSKPPKSKRITNDIIDTGLTVLNVEGKHRSSSSSRIRSSSTNRSGSRTRAVGDIKNGSSNKENGHRRRSSSSTRSASSPTSSTGKKSGNSPTVPKSGNNHTSALATIPSTSKFTEWSTSEDGFVVFNVNSKNNNLKSNDIV